MKNEQNQADRGKQRIPLKLVDQGTQTSKGLLGDQEVRPGPTAISDPRHQAPGSEQESLGQHVSQETAEKHATKVILVDKGTQTSRGLEKGQGN